MLRGLSSRVLVTSGLLAALVGGVFAVMLLALAAMEHASAAAGRAEEVAVASIRLEKLVVDLETGVRGYQITHRPAFLQPWSTARRQLAPAFSQLEGADAGDARQTGQVSAAEAAIRSYVRDYSQPLVHALERGRRPAGGTIAATAEGKRRVDAIRRQLGRLVRGKGGVAAAQRAAAHASARRAIGLGAAGLVGSVLLIALFAMNVMRLVAAPLRGIAAAARSLAEGDLSERVPARGPAEVAELGRAFNAMAASLARTYGDLEGHAAELEAQQDELEQALGEVRRGEERYRSLVRNLPGGCVFLFDHELRVLVADGSGLASLGLRREQLEGRTVGEAFGAEAAPGIEAAYRRVLAGESRRSEYERDGRIFDVQLLPLRGDGGAIAGGMALMQDTTDRVHAQRALAAGERRYRQVLETANDGFVALDGDGRIVEWNRKAELMFGLARDEALGRSAVETLLPAGQHRRHRAALRTFLASGTGPLAGSPVELVARRADGSSFPVELTMWRLEDDGALRANGFVRDITERVEAREEMQRLAYQHAADLAAVADVARQLPSTSDANHARRAICEAALEVSGGSMAMLIEPDGTGRLISTAAAGADLSRSEFSLDDPRSASVRAFRGGRPVFVTDMARGAGVTHLPIAGPSSSALWQPVLHDGVAIGVLFIGWREQVEELSQRTEAIARLFAAEAAVAIERADFLSHLDELNRELAMQVEALRLSDQYKTDFISSVSHELRTPLASIIGYLEVLREEELEGEERDEFLGIVADNARRLLALINDLLTLAGLESGRVRLHASDTDLRDLVETAVREQLPALNERGQELVLELPEEPVLAHVDGERLLQVFANLLANALKFTPAGGRIALRVRGDGEEALVEVADTGIGIPPEDLDRLFERFFRARSATERAIPGTGLGLAISRSIVDAHHGTISVRSRLGEGTTFAVSLPQAAEPAEVLAA